MDTLLVPGEVTCSISREINRYMATHGGVEPKKWAILRAEHEALRHELGADDDAIINVLSIPVVVDDLLYWEQRA
jgi:hypothetical protein